jgi:hypothetical protein
LAGVAAPRLIRTTLTLRVALLVVVASLVVMPLTHGVASDPDRHSPDSANQSISTSFPSNSLSRRQHSGVMTASIESPRRGGAETRRDGWWRNTLAARLVLAATFMAILFGAVYASGHWAYAIASVVGFAIAITLIAAAVINWERLVAAARSAGLVESSD